MRILELYVLSLPIYAEMGVVVFGLLCQRNAVAIGAGIRRCLGN